MWADWVTLCPGPVPSRWKPKYLRLTPTTLQYFDANPNPTSTSTSTSTSTLTSTAAPNPLTQLSPPHADNSRDFPTDDTQDFQLDPQISKHKDDADLDHAPNDADPNDAPLPPTLLGGAKLSSSLSTSQGTLALESLTAFCLLGARAQASSRARQQQKQEEEEEASELVQFHVDQCSRSHRVFHSGAPTLLLIHEHAEAPRIWRVRFDKVAALEALLACLEHAVPRGIVRASGWLYTAGKLNWNRRYSLVVSTGNLLVFRDPSLEELRRNIPLGVSTEIEAATDGEEEEEELIARVKSGVRFEVLRIRLTSPHVPEKKGYAFCVDASKDEGPEEVLRLHKQWLR